MKEFAGKIAFITGGACGAGLGYAKVGSKLRLVIPPDLGYGSHGVASIPPFSTLIFTVELLGIE